MSSTPRSHFPSASSHHNPIYLHNAFFIKPLRIFRWPAPTIKQTTWQLLRTRITHFSMQTVGFDRKSIEWTFKVFIGGYANMSMGNFFPQATVLPSPSNSDTSSNGSSQDSMTEQESSLELKCLTFQWTMMTSNCTWQIPTAGCPTSSITLDTSTPLWTPCVLEVRPMMMTVSTPVTKELFTFGSLFVSFWINRNSTAPASDGLIGTRGPSRLNPRSCWLDTGVKEKTDLRWTMTSCPEVSVNTTRKVTVPHAWFTVNHSCFRNNSKTREEAASGL